MQVTDFNPKEKIMARCIDFPCCGHESGCCPDFDEDGQQLNMVCVCGAKLPLTSRYSICNSCMNLPEEDNPYDREGGSGYGGYYNEY